MNQKIIKKMLEGFGLRHIDVVDNGMVRKEKKFDQFSSESCWDGEADILQHCTDGHHGTLNLFLTYNCCRCLNWMEQKVSCFFILILTPPQQRKSFLQQSQKINNPVSFRWNRILSFKAIIALTANAFPEDKEHYLSCGMKYVITKPINRDELRATVLWWRHSSLTLHFRFKQLLHRMCHGLKTAIRGQPEIRWTGTSTKRITHPDFTHYTWTTVHWKEKWTYSDKKRSKITEGTQILYLIPVQNPICQHMISLTCTHGSCAERNGFDFRWKGIWQNVCVISRFVQTAWTQEEVHISPKGGKNTLNCSQTRTLTFKQKQQFFNEWCFKNVTHPKSCK